LGLQPFLLQKILRHSERSIENAESKNLGTIDTAKIPRLAVLARDDAIAVKCLDKVLKRSCKSYAIVVCYKM
jgi:hypothetical protein